MKIETLICERCGHGRAARHPWIPRQSRRPRRCPRCGSPYWFVARGVLPRGAAGHRARRAAP